jgi:hypothetical protein
MRQRNNELSDSSNSDEDEDKERSNDFKEGEEEVSHLAKSLLTSDCVRQDAILEAAGFHATQARTMRAIVQRRTTEAIESVIAPKRHNTRDRVLV